MAKVGDKSERTVKVSNIVGLSEIAERTGATPHAVWNWTKRSIGGGNHPFPAPIATVSGRPVFDWAEVDVWNTGWVRSKGGFHTHKARRNMKENASAPATQSEAKSRKRTTDKPADKPAAAGKGKSTTRAARPKRGRGDSSDGAATAAPSSPATSLRRARRSRASQ